MEKRLALIVDDEPALLDTVALILIRSGLAVETALNVQDAKAKLSKLSFDLCLTDMRLPDGTGLDLITHINKEYPNTPVAMITAYGNMDVAVQALKAGAFDCVNKPVDLNQLRQMVQHALNLRAASLPEAAKDAQARPDAGKAELSAAVKVDSNTLLGRMLGKSSVMQDVAGKITKLARSQAPVHIAGESGTGKELAARAIHEQSPRATGSFIPVNCGAIPSELMESEFFGHKRGSFTGAQTDKDGLFKAAHGGTLFLDEVAELPMHMQVKLLRVLQEKTVRPIGENKELPIDVRLLSATHKDLAKLVELGQFRQDLYYRINVIELKLPPLRDRDDDVLLLAEHFLAKLAGDWGIAQPVLSDSARAALQNYGFPGNVRELQNTLERAVALCENDMISAGDLQLKAATGMQPAVPSDPVEARAALERASLVDQIDSLQRDVLVKALDETRWNRTAAAKKLGITFRAMRYRLKKLGIE
jgi:two-component system, NtrC family, response regulator PilR